jgi:hypothetical protein
MDRYDDITNLNTSRLSGKYVPEKGQATKGTAINWVIGKI